MEISFFPDSKLTSQIIKYLKEDKISSKGEIRLVLLEDFGKFKIMQNISNSLIKESIFNYDKFDYRQ